MALTPAQIVNTLAPIVGKVGAAGIAGNLMQESSDNPGDAGGGLAQWQGSRYTGLVKYAQSRGLPTTSAQAALGYLAQDLKGPYSSLAQQLKSAQNPGHAAVLFSNIYERPGIPMIQNRINYAQQAFGSSGGKGLPAIPAQKTPGMTSTTIPGVTTTSLDKNAFNQANARYIAGSFLQQSQKNNPYGVSASSLIGPGLLTTKAPDPQDFQQTSTTPAMKVFQTAQGKLEQIAGTKLTPHPAVAINPGNLKGFKAGSGVNVTVGNTPKIATRLAALGRKLGVTIVAISGYRTPAHSVAVGGFADDPHTKGNAVDIGVNGELRASAAQLSNKQLASVGLWRPFDQDGSDPAEVNHIELIGQK